MREIRWHMSAAKKLLKVLALSISLLAPSFSMAGSGIILPPTSGGGGGSGDVTAASSFGTDNRIIRSDGTGKGVQSSAITVDDSGNVLGVGSISASSMSLSSLTASTALALDGSKNLVSVTNTGSGNNVLATSPTLTTPTLGSATATSVSGASGSGAFSLRAGTTAADSLVLNARDVDGATNIPFVTLTSKNTPSMAINVPAGTTGTMDGVTIGGTTAAAGTFTTISQSGVHTFSANSTITSGNYQIGRNASNQFVFNSPGQAFLFSSNGNQRLFLDDFQYNFTQGAATSGTFTAVRVTGGAHTGLTASTENSDVVYALNRTVQFSTGALTTQRAVVINAPTYAFASASTLTTAATMAISGAPIAGTNATLTNSYALWIQSGFARFDGGISIDSTLTAGGTTGAQTINKAAGSVNFAAAATTLVVTDSLVKTNSIVITTAMTNDATCSVKDVEVASGSFTIRMNAACTAETKVGFVVYN